MKITIILPYLEASYIINFKLFLKIFLTIIINVIKQSKMTLEIKKNIPIMHFVINNYDCEEDTVFTTWKVYKRIPQL